MTDRKLRVFLCHASQDKPVVRELYRKLLAEGWIDAWLDEEKLLPGQDWDTEIEKAVESADAVIVCISDQSVTKEGYVQKEIRKVLDVALEKPDETIFIVPVRLGECELPRRLRVWHYMDYFPAERRNWAFERLLQSLRLRFGGSKSEADHGNAIQTASLVPPIESDEQDIPKKETGAHVINALPSKGSREGDVGRSLPLGLYFGLAAFDLLQPGQTALQFLLGLSAILAGTLLLIRNQIPSSPVFKISAISFLLIYVMLLYAELYGTDFPFEDVVSVLGAATALIAGGAVIATFQSRQKSALYTSISFAIFLFLVALKLTLNLFDFHPGWPYLLIIVTSVITAILLSRDF